MWPNKGNCWFFSKTLYTYYLGDAGIISAQNGSSDVVKELKEHGAETNSKDEG